MPINNLALGVSEPEKVTAFLENFEHPLLKLIHYLRALILQTDPHIGEGIYWNAPTFYYTGPLAPFEAKTYKRYIACFVFNKKDCVRLVFLKGSIVYNHGNILEGTYTDGRRIAVFKSLEELKELVNQKIQTNVQHHHSGI